MNQEYARIINHINCIIKAVKFIKQALMCIHIHIGPDTVRVHHFYIPRSNLYRSFRQKINKELQN